MIHHSDDQGVVTNWRARLLLSLATERANLLWQLVGLDEGTLTGPPVFDDWTAKDLLTHVAAWDEVSAERIALIASGREQQIAAVDEDARNAVFYAERKDWPLVQAVEAFVTARIGFLARLAKLPDEEVLRVYHIPWGEATVRRWTEWRARHDAIHTADLVAWRETQRLKRGNGPPEILVAALNAAREELLAAAALIPLEERTSRPVCGEWTLKDVLGHVTDWEWVGVEGLRYMATGRPPEVEHIENIDAWNQVHAEARRDQPWDVVWADLHAAREVLLQVLEGMGQDDLGRSFRFPWGPGGTCYQWVSVYLVHDRSHVLRVEGTNIIPAG
jgi:uncharacterized damage-inducible protein DinB